VHPAALGALLRHAVGERARAAAGAAPEALRGAVLEYRCGEGIRCASADCIGALAPHAAPAWFLLLARDPALLECRYCGARTEAFHLGSREAGRHHPVGSADAAKVLDQNLVLFRTPEEAAAAGFERSLREAGESGA